MRITTAAIVIGIFFGLGYIKRTDFLGLGFLIDSQLAFFAAGFILVTVIAFVWILYLRKK